MSVLFSSSLLDARHSRRFRKAGFGGEQAGEITSLSGSVTPARKSFSGCSNLRKDRSSDLLARHRAFAESSRADCSTRSEPSPLRPPFPIPEKSPNGHFRSSQPHPSKNLQKIAGPRGRETGEVASEPEFVEKPRCPRPIRVPPSPHAFTVGQGILAIRAQAWHERIPGGSGKARSRRCSCKARSVLRKTR